MLFLKAFGVWMAMLLAAFINGAIRETLIVPRVGERMDHRGGSCRLRSGRWVPICATA
jgi:hypothetical protein